jgi:hypothetical protein
MQTLLHSSARSNALPRHPTRARRTLGALLALGACALAACASTAREPSRERHESRALRVTLRDYRNGQRFELVSESHTSALELYSQKRGSASTKVQSDEVMQGLVDFLRDQDFDRHAAPGKAPLQAQGGYTNALEVDRAGQVMHMLGGTAVPAAEQKVLAVCRANFLLLYNETDSWQTVDNRAGEGVFQTQPLQP